MESNGNINVEIEDVIEANEEDIKEFEDNKNDLLQRPKSAKKKERSEKQIQALKKAQETRRNNIQLRKEGKLAPKITKKQMAKQEEIVMEEQHPDVQYALEEYEAKEEAKYKKISKKKKPVRRKIIIQQESSSESEEEEVIVIQSNSRTR